MQNMSVKQRDITAVGSTGRQNRPGVMVLGLLILALLFVSPREAAGVVRLA